MVLVSLITFSCTWMKPVEKAQKPVIQALSHEELIPIAGTGIDAFDLAKRDMLETVFWVKVDPKGKKLLNDTDYFLFKKRYELITYFDKNPEGYYTEQTITESWDEWGRIDLSENKIVYRLRRPNTQETATMKKRYLEVAKTYSRLDRAARKDFRAGVAAQQKALGLKADGALGPETAEKMAADTDILEVQEIASRIVYPKAPAHAIYVVDAEILKKDKEKYLNGFESIKYVSEQALDREQFAITALPDKEFAVFVFFFDRVDPRRAISVGIGNFSKRVSNCISTRCYAKPDTWPVLIEYFKIDQELKSDKLYVNLFLSDVDEGGIQNVFQRARCIGCTQIK
jgi:hypothetical protein